MWYQGEGNQRGATNETGMFNGQKQEIHVAAYVFGKKRHIDNHTILIYIVRCYSKHLQSVWAQPALKTCSKHI